MPKRVVVTGLGVVSPLGIGKDAFWQGLVAGQSGIREISAFDTSEYSITRGGEVVGFDPRVFMSEGTAQRVGRASQYAIAAARMALEDAAVDLQALDRSRAGVSLGTTMGEIQAIEKITALLHSGGARAVPASLLAQFPVYHISANVAGEFEFSGPNLMLPTACAAGNYAIGYALDLLRSGRADAMIAGGVDPLSQIAFTGFHKLNSMARDCPRPFSKDREGMMVSEGAGVLVLETEEHAARRSARIYAELLDYGLSCDAHHMTAPHPEGQGALRAMQSALSRAGLPPERLDYINAHGTGTPANDKVETLAIKRLLGDRAHAVPVTSIKSMLGHTMGAASALEAIACVLIVQQGLIPPTANYQEPDPDCDLDYVPNTARWAEVRVAMSNSYAFGGNNASLIVSQVSQ